MEDDSFKTLGIIGHVSAIIRGPTCCKNTSFFATRVYGGFTTFKRLALGPRCKNSGVCLIILAFSPRVILNPAFWTQHFGLVVETVQKAHTG